MLRPLILLLALAAGGGAAWIAAEQIAPAAVEIAPAPSPVAETTAVLVAARDVPRGGEVRADALKWLPWPADAVPAGFIERTARPDASAKLAGHFARRPISAGEPIIDQALSQEPTGFLAATLAPGKRAVAISASTRSTAGGFILPNDRVDVLHTRARSRERDSGDVYSRTILRGVRVLAIDQTSENIEKGTVLGETATLELTEPQVEAVTTAQATGSLSLSLRPRDEAPREASMEAVFPHKTIRIRRGNSIEEVDFN